MGLIDDTWPLSPRDPDVIKWEDVENKDEWDLTMAVYAAMIDRMDQGKAREGHEALYWQTLNNGLQRAIRKGKWKMVTPSAQDPWELYDLSVDRTELHDLALQNPNVVRELNDMWESWAVRCGVPLDIRALKRSE